MSALKTLMDVLMSARTQLAVTCVLVAVAIV